VLVVAKTTAQPTPNVVAEDLDLISQVVEAEDEEEEGVEGTEET
jgi:hypothetical protein